MKRHHGKNKDNHENKNNVETQKLWVFCYVPQKLMYFFSFPTFPYFSTSLYLPLQTDEDK